MKLLILSNNSAGYSTQKLKTEAESRGHSVDVKNPLSLVPYISETTSGHDHLYEKTEDGQQIRVLSKTYDCVLPRFAGNGFAYGVSVLEHLAGNLCVPVANDAFGLTVASDKLLSHQALSSSKVRTIKTLFVNQPVDFQWIVKKLGLPIVVKTPHGSQGSGVFILETELSISTTLAAFSRINKNLILQRFIDSGQPKSDLRIYVVDGKVVTGYRRWALSSDFRSNWTISGQGTKSELTDEEKELAVNAATACGLAVAGIDIVRDSSNNDKPHVIEVNSNASLKGIETVTKVNIASSIIDYCEKIARKPKGEADNSLSAYQGTTPGNQATTTPGNQATNQEPEGVKGLSAFIRRNQTNRAAIWQRFEQLGL